MAIDLEAIRRRAQRVPVWDVRENRETEVMVLLPLADFRALTRLTKREVARGLRRSLAWLWPIYFLGYLLAPYLPWTRRLRIRERTERDIENANPSQFAIEQRATWSGRSHLWN